MVWSGLGMTPKDTAVSIMAKTALTNDKGWNCHEKVKYGRDHEELESLYKSVLPLTRRWTECNHWYSFPFCQTLLLMMIMVRHLDDSVDVEATNEHWHCPIISLQPIFLMISAIRNSHIFQTTKKGAHWSWLVVLCAAPPNHPHQCGPLLRFRAMFYPTS